MYYLSDYQTFENKQEMNEAVSEHLRIHRYELSDTVQEVLTILSRYSVKYPGACHLKNATLAKEIGKTSRTVRRAISKLVELGIIEKVPFMRSVSGGYGANVYRILPPNVHSNKSDREQAEKPTETRSEQSENVKEPFNSFKQTDVINNTYSKATFQSFYARFKSVVSLLNIDGMQSLISRLYGVYKAHSTPLLRGQAFDKQSVEQVGMQALKTAIQATKRKRIRNLAGYYNGVLDRMLDRLFYAEMMQATE